VLAETLRQVSDLSGVLRIRLADGSVGILGRINWLFDGRWGGLCRGAQMEFNRIRLHVLQMPKVLEWKPGLSWLVCAGKERLRVAGGRSPL
jgi:hypothetical protein